mmetsp:Transcript_45532/g.72014  ORF Transcript_45532/g.72014 Transcript_45532/m.72014 type:complete len:97 (-) Transcript_45532:1056-1346(-)
MHQGLPANVQEKKFGTHMRRITESSGKQIWLIDSNKVQGRKTVQSLDATDFCIGALAHGVWIPCGRAKDCNWPSTQNLRTHTCLYIEIPAAIRICW